MWAEAPTALLSSDSEPRWSSKQEANTERGSLMNVGGLVGALLPVFFVLALGYLAGKWNEFDADQAAGLSKLALSFALPASLFVAMPEIPRHLLLQPSPLVPPLIPPHVDLSLF